MSYKQAGRELPRFLRDVAHAELDATEPLLWTGQPDPARTSRQCLPIVLFGIPWTAFALFWMWGASGFGSGFSKGVGPWLLFPLFGLPFVLIGVSMLLSPQWARRRARATGYAITDRRILILTVTGKVRKVETYVPTHVAELERLERADGSGDLVFRKQHGRDSDGDRTTQRIGFWGIPDVRSVERLLRETFAEEDDAPLAANVRR